MKWLIRHPIVVALSFIAVGLLDPFGLRSASDRASQNILLRFLAPFYRSNDQPITVVLFDDRSIQALGESWPPPYAVTTRLLHRIVCAKPRAMFIDLLFTHQHKNEPDSSFENLILNLTGERGCPSDAPIFVADMADQRNYLVPNGSAVHERLRGPIGSEQQESLLSRKPIRTIQRVPVNWVAAEGLYPLVLKTTNRSDWPTTLGDDKRHLPTPAFALYRVADTAAKANDFTAPMVVRWGFRGPDPPEGADRIVPDGECAESGGSDMLIAIKRLIQDGLRILDSPGPWQPCPYSFFVSAHTALADSDNETRDAIFRGRYVLIGTRLAGSGDVTPSPVHGQLPGVFMHAMALDNLLRYHDHYWRPMPMLAEDGPLSRIGSEALLTVALYLVLVWFGAKFLRPRRRKCHASGHHDLAYALIVLELALAILVILAVMLVLLLLDYFPINWLGLLGLVGVTTFFSTMFEQGVPAEEPSQHFLEDRKWLNSSRIQLYCLRYSTWRSGRPPLARRKSRDSPST